jgi:hypothetical protein
MALPFLFYWDMNSFKHASSGRQFLRRNKHFSSLSKGVSQKIDFISGPANIGALPLWS